MSNLLKKKNLIALFNSSKVCEHEVCKGRNEESRGGKCNRDIQVILE